MRVFLAFVLCLLAGQAMAIEPYTCRNGLFPSLHNIKAAVVLATNNKPVYFRNDDKDCPDRSSCITPRSAVSGSRVLVAEITDQWACAWYFANQHSGRWRNWREFVGWIPASELKLLPAATPTLRNWVGTWTGAAATIRISRWQNGMLHVSGNARWYGAMQPSGERDIHYGAMGGKAAPMGNTLAVGNMGATVGCAVRLRLVGSYLVATDNHHCGGVNVSFDDVYQRRP